MKSSLQNKKFQQQPTGGYKMSVRISDLECVLSNTISHADGLDLTVEDIIHIICDELSVQLEYFDGDKFFEKITQDRKQPTK